ncbi:hypothetical protein D3C85_1108620 [compost metagenome]
MVGFEIAPPVVTCATPGILAMASTKFVAADCANLSRLIDTTAKLLVLLLALNGVPVMTTSALSITDASKAKVISCCVAKSISFEVVL